MPTSPAGGAGLSSRDLEGTTGSSVSSPQTPKQLARGLWESKGDPSGLEATLATGNVANLTHENESSAKNQSPS